MCNNARLTDVIGEEASVQEVLQMSSVKRKRVRGVTRGITCKHLYGQCPIALSHRADLGARDILLQRSHKGVSTMIDDQNDTFKPLHGWLSTILILVAL